MEIKKIDSKEYGLEETQVQSVDQAFAEKVAERELLTKVYENIIKKEINKETAKEAKEFKNKATKVKTSIAKIHKTQKEYALAFGKYCDAWKRKETEPIQQMIDGALEIEKFEEIQEQKRLEKLQSDRVELLSEYLIDADERDLCGMDEDVWQAYLQAKKQDHEDRIAAEKKAKFEQLEKEKNDKLRTHRRELSLPFRDFWTENEKNIDFAEISQDEFDTFFNRVKSEKVKKDNELSEKKRLYNERSEKLKGLWETMPPKYANISYIDMSGVEFETMLNDAIEEKKKIDEERIKSELKQSIENEKKEKIRAERNQKLSGLFDFIPALYHDGSYVNLTDNAFLLLVENAEKEKEIFRKRTIELTPYISFIRDYDRMILLPDTEYSIELSKIKEAKVLKDKIEAEEAEKSKGDAEKVSELIEKLESIKHSYTFESKQNKKMFSDVFKLIDKVVGHINKNKK